MRLNKVVGATSSDGFSSGTFTDVIFITDDSTHSTTRCETVRLAVSYLQFPIQVCFLAAVP